MMKHLKPLVIGAVMGPMVVWMLHQALTGESTMGIAALGGFIAIHLLLGAVVIGAAVFAARLSPTWRARISRLHRPSLAHVAAMVIGMAGAGFAIHVVLHGGIV